MTRLKKFWIAIIAASLSLWAVNHFLTLELKWYWIVAPVWVPWSIIIILGEFNLIRKYVKNQYWK